ncbi:Vacuolar protein sorting-associated protein 72-like protein [Lachnellula hyalina]|uniref:Vacuolar protein sorting-associated protein 72-like protein n=1 Tax=Lachnellula hyalina TaxID=1316788 RepID=A0A8H8TYB7_9HELO|nr:Vacuolar protein sorting-associated protein 72-like protein [Lachnellula hyalina]TVY26964.1 Vacuolar protein sorting-associated protein 72-like protein [Lachnellula hyalina]
MADVPEEDTPLRTEDDDSESDSGSGSDSGSDAEQPEVEWLATSRAKRSTAGNRLNALLQQEEPDDELELLFAEDDEDEVFEDAEADQSDVQMDSSSDDEDQGPAAGADDLDGEKEIQRQAKVERQAKRRKLNDGIPKVKRRVRIDPTVNEPAPRPKKKSERASWIPTAEDAPTRASARGTTKQSKQQLHQQMLEREIKRLKQVASMERAAAAKEAAKKPALTQEDRLKEAARVEKSNSRSLSKWEETEQAREEEQRLRLAALHNRTLEGPVITWWSGFAEYVGGKLKKVGTMLTVTEKEKAGRKRKATEMEADAAKAGEASKEKANSQGPQDTVIGDSKAPPTLDSTTDEKPPTDATLSAASPAPEQEKKTASASPQVEAAPIQASPEPPKPLPMLAPPVGFSVPTQPPASSVLAPPPINRPPVFTPPPQANGQPLHPAFTLAPPAQPTLDGSAPLPGFGYNFMTNYPPNLPTSQIPFGIHPHAQPDVPPPPPTIEHSNRNYLILTNFDENAIKEKDVQTQILFNRKFLKLRKTKPPPELCAITSYPAKYRDPATGLPYCSAFAYKEIQRLQKGDYKWSKLVGAYVGSGTYAARGVPARFTNPAHVSTPQP